MPPTVDQSLNSLWLQQLRRAAEVVTELEDHLANARRDRDEIIVRAIDEGHHTWMEVARAGRIAKSRVTQILADTRLGDR